MINNHLHTQDCVASNFNFSSTPSNHGREKRLRLAYPRLILNAMCRRDINIYELLQNSVLDSTTLLNPHSHIASSEYKNIVNLSKKYFRSKSVSEEIYRQTSTQTRNLIGKIALTSESMIDAINNVAKFSSLLGNTQLETTTEDGFLFVSHKDALRDVACSNVDIESIFSFLLSLLSQLNRSKVDPHECVFGSDSRATRALPKSIYGKRISYGSDSNHMIFKINAINPKNKDFNTVQNRQYIDKAIQYLSELSMKNKISTSVLMYLRQCDLQSKARIDDAAIFLRLSSRIIQRQLSSENTSFIKLLDRVRFEKSVELIRADNLNFKSIAFFVGYNSVPAFHNAFRRWTGETPSDFKSQFEKYHI